MIVNSVAKNKVAPLPLCAEHGHLHLVIVAVSMLQFDVTVIDGKTVAFVGSNSVTHGKVSGFLKSTSPRDGESSGSVTQPSGIIANQG